MTGHSELAPTYLYTSELIYYICMTGAHELAEAYIRAPYTLHIFSHPIYLYTAELTCYICMTGADALA